MVEIHYRNNLFALVLDGSAVSGGRLAIDDYQRHSILAIPIEGCDTRMAVCGHIQASRERRVTLSSNFNSIEIGEFEYELVPNFPVLPRGFTPQVIMQRESDGLLATVYQDYGRHILIEDEYAFCNHSITDDITDITIGYTAIGRLVIVTGDCYLAIFNCDNQDIKLLLERHGGKPVFREDAIDIVFQREDMMQRTVTETYTLSGAGCQLSERVFRHNLEHKYIAELLPHLLIDAFIAEDYEFATSILSSDLAANIMTTKSFFGDIISFYGSSGHASSSNSLRLLIDDGGKQVVREYSFCCEGYRITDINQL